MSKKRIKVVLFFVLICLVLYGAYISFPSTAFAERGRMRHGTINCLYCGRTINWGVYGGAVVTYQGDQGGAGQKIRGRFDCPWCGQAMNFDLVQAQISFWQPRPDE